MTDHPNALTLERYAVGELTGASARAITTHAHSCDACRAYLGELEDNLADQLARVPPARFVAALHERAGHRPGLRIWFASAFALAAAAAVLVLVLRRGTDDVDAITLKGTANGAAGLAFNHQRGARITFGALPQLRSGDALSPVVTLAEPAKIAVWFVDVSGRVDVLIAPSQGGELAAGTHVVPASATIESPCVDTWVVVGVGSSASIVVEHQLRSGQLDNLPIHTTTAFLRCE